MKRAFEAPEHAISTCSSAPTVEESESTPMMAPHIVWAPPGGDEARVMGTLGHSSRATRRKPLAPVTEEGFDGSARPCTGSCPPDVSTTSRRLAVPPCQWPETARTVIRSELITCGSGAADG